MCAVQGNTALVYACTHGLERAVEFLLSAGADAVLQTEQVGLHKLMLQCQACKAQVSQFQSTGVSALVMRPLNTLF